jgi:ketosteroid isomerase-like protein
MSEANVEIVQAAFEAFERGDMEGVLRLCDENIEIRQAGELPGVEPRQQGHAGIVTTLQRGRGKASGVQVETHSSFLFSIRAGRIAEWCIFMREAEALKAAGLAE